MGIKTFSFGLIRVTRNCGGRLQRLIDNGTG